MLVGAIQALETSPDTAMRLLTLLPLAATALQAPNQRAPIQRRSTARAAFSFSEAADSLKLDEASSKAADAAAKGEL